jgi:hypothetical protein
MLVGSGRAGPGGVFGLDQVIGSTVRLSWVQSGWVFGLGWVVRSGWVRLSSIQSGKEKIKINCVLQESDKATLNICQGLQFHW